MSLTRRQGRTGQVALSLLLAVVLVLSGLGLERDPAGSPDTEAGASDVLTRAQRQRVDEAIDRALRWMAGQQGREGEFLTRPTGQPAVSSLVVLAFLSCGHLPGEGPYGDVVIRGIDFVMGCQKANGLLAYIEPEPEVVWGNAAHTDAYNHAIAGLLLCEAYGMTDGARAERLRPAIEKALEFARRRIPSPKREQRDRGGWRYVRKKSAPPDSDLSITSWYLLFLRSAKNAGFDVPSGHVDEAVEYVKRCFDNRTRRFAYAIGRREQSRGMSGAGILSLSLGGLHDTAMARAAGDTLLRDPFPAYNVPGGGYERYHYATFYCSQAMFQLGGRYWEQYYPGMVKQLLANQNPDGSWDAEVGNDAMFGNVYTTALVVLALTPPYQLLPIFQR